MPVDWRHAQSANGAQLGRHSIRPFNSLDRTASAEENRKLNPLVDELSQDKKRLRDVAPTKNCWGPDRRHVVLDRSVGRLLACRLGREHVLASIPGSDRDRRKLLY